MKLKFKKPKSQLDEMQEQTLRKIESRGFHIAMFCLSVLVGLKLGWQFGYEDIAIQAGELEHYSFDFSSVAGELTILVILILYSFFACYKAGIWDRYLPATKKIVVVLSLLMSILMSILAFERASLLGWAGFESIKNILLTFFVSFAICLCFSTFCLVLYMKRRAKLDSISDEP